MEGRCQGAELEGGGQGHDPGEALEEAGLNPVFSCSSRVREAGTVSAGLEAVLDVDLASWQVQRIKHK